MNVYEIITDRIVSMLEAGTVPWHKPWAGGETPKNLVSGKPYRGVNVFLLGSAGYSSPWFLTYRQAEARSGHVRKGERGSPVIFWQWREREAADGTIDRSPLLRYYTIFNVEQCEGITAPSTVVSRPFSPIESCEGIIAGFANAPKIEHREPQAYYRPSTDTINMPPRESFETAEAYYSTIFHELGHSTGHASRLARKGVTDPTLFGSHAYSKEELCAEMTAAFLGGVAGIAPATLDQTAAYLASWRRKLRSETRWVVEAAAQAQRAADLILGTQASTGEAPESTEQAA